MATKTNPYSGMTSEQLQRERERIIRRMKFAYSVLAGALAAMVISAAITLLLQFHVIH